MAMKNVTVTFTRQQADIILNMIRNDTASMESAGCEKRFIQQNDRMEERLIKAIMKSEGRI
jgi:hypothetical protein